MSGFSHLFMGVSALRTFRNALNNVGNNVANAATDGFSRRRISLDALPDRFVGGVTIGQGVEANTSVRLRDRFLDFATRRELGRFESDSKRSEVLGSLEPLFGDVTNAPINGAVSALFDAYERLSVQADDPTVRRSVVNAAQDLAAELRRTDGRLIESRQDANGRVEETVTRINEITTEIAVINKEIPAGEAGAAEASQLRDARDLLLDELSGLAPIRTVETSSGTVSVHLEGSGDTLLTGTRALPLTLAQDSEGQLRVQVSRGGEIVDVSDRIRGGQLGGLLAVRDDAIPTYRQQLDDLAASVITEFNAIQTSGFDLNGVAGIALFQPDPPGAGAAGTIAVDAAFDADPELIAAADAGGGASNNAIALAVAALRESPIGALGGRTLGEAAAGLVSEVGRDVAAARAGRDASGAIVDSLELRRRAVSGVSLDEEAAELLRFQQSFQATARFMEVVDRVTEIALQAFAR